ncbi:hypothetical protein CDAR_620711 [Caerostris darwini]|uniref:Uncharacterized protein n=1 Tax=Caerostris darwini TaxID=1538125 RepID=A0AAV4NI44_9ARAC|nr:hypothetical protein CDAR_620711 [Caerostris darwini]
MKLMKRLTGVTLSASQNVLANTYKSYVRLIFDYGSELLIIAANSVLAKLDVTQNCALCLITRAAKVTLAESMVLQKMDSASIFNP